MNVNMKKGLSAVSMAFGLTFVWACTPGGTGTEPECTSDTDCDGTMQCHPVTQTCEEDCTLEGQTCPAAAPVCNGPDDNGDYPLELEDANADEALRLLCVCVTDSDCGDGEVCNHDTAKCEAGEPVNDTCTPETVADDCAADQLCIDSACQDECIDDACFPTGELCDTDDTVATYNQCVTAEDLTAGCTDADGAPAQSGGPIVIYDVEVLGSEADACPDPDFNLPLRYYLLSVYSEIDISGDADAAKALLFRPGFDAGNEKFYDVDSIDAPEAGAEDNYFVTVYVCGNPDIIAAQIDDGTNTSNAYCFDATP